MSAVIDGPSLHFQDCSARPRCGCKGPGAEAWLRAGGYRVPATPNSAALDVDGVLVARLATSEFLLEATRGSGAGVERVLATRALLAARAQPRDVFAVARQDGACTISGGGLNDLLRQVCSVDFAPLLAGGAMVHPGTVEESPVLLTSMVGIGVLAWPRIAAGEPTVTIWCEPSFGHYFWTTLREVGRDGGNLIEGSDQ